MRYVKMLTEEVYGFKSQSGRAEFTKKRGS